jgi:hypothetical protein
MTYADLKAEYEAAAAALIVAKDAAYFANNADVTAQWAKALGQQFNEGAAEALRAAEAWDMTCRDRFRAAKSAIHDFSGVTLAW